MAATDTWGGSSSVNWSDAGNWSPGVPGANDTVVINQSGANAPSNYDISQTFQSVTFDTGATITNAGTNTFGIASGGFITDNASTAVVFDSSTPVTLNGAATINVASGASLTFGGGLTGTGPVTVNNGGGSLIFLGASNYTGGTNINAGSLQLGNGTSDGTIGGNVSLNGTSTSLIFDENSNSVVYSNTISGTGGVTQEGGLVTFTGTQTYSGLTSIVGGSTLQLGDGVANNGMISGDAAVASGATLAFDEPNTATYAGNITGGGQVTISGPGTVIFTGAGNNYGGGTTINGTTLQIGTDALQGSISASGGIALSGGTIDFHNLTQSTFDYGGVISGAGNVAIDNNTVVYTNVDSYLGTTTIGSNGTLQLGVAGGAVGGINQAGAIVDNGKVVFQNVGASAEIDGGITGTGSVTVALGSATDTVILTGTNSYASGSPTTKDTTITTGVLQIGNFTSSLTGSLAGNVSIGSAGTLDFNDIDPANNTFSGVISGNGTLEVDNGTLILTNSGNVISTADIGTNGTLQIGNGLLNTVGGTNYVGSLFGTTINDNGTLAFEPPAATTFVITQGISGSGVLTQNGPGTTILTGNDALTGGATVVAGTLEFGSGAQFTGSGTFGVDSGATLAFGNTSSFTFGSQITGAGNVSVVGSAPVILTNSDDYSGTTTINAGGTLQVGNSTTAGAITGTSGVSVAAGGIFSFVNSSSPTFSAPISGGGVVDVNVGSGNSIALSSTSNTYSGGTTIDSGTLSVSSHNNLGTGTISFTSATANGATLQVTGADTFSQRISLAAGGGTIDTAGNNVIWSGVIADAAGVHGALTVDDSTGPSTGMLILTGTNTYTGGTTITSNGTLQIGNGGGAGSIKGSVTDNGALDFDFGGSTNFSGAISGTGQVTQDDTTGGTLTLSGTNTGYSGAVSVASGTLAVSSDANLGDQSATNTVTIYQGAVLQTTATGTFANEVFLNGSATLSVKPGTNATWSGQIVDGTSLGTLNVTGGGTLTLNSGNNTYSNGTVVSGNSTLSIDQDAELGGSGGALTLGGTSPNSGGTLAVTNSFTLGAGRTVTLAGSGGTINTASGVTFEIAQGIAGTGPLNVTGAGTFRLAGTSSYTGNTNIGSGATLQLGDGTNAGSIAGTGTVSDSGTLVFDEGGNATFANPIIGTGGLTQNDAASGTLTLTGNDTYSGATNIISGTLQLGDGTNAGTLQSASIVDGTALVFDEPSSTSYGGVISGSGTVEVGGTGTLTLTGNNSYTGTTTIDTGATLQVGNGGSSGSIGNSTSIVDNGTLTIDTNGTTLLTGAISGAAGQLNQVGGGTTILAADNTYGGMTTVTAGTLQIGNGGATGSIQSDVANGGTVVFDTSGTSTYSHVISGSGKVTIANQATGTTVFTGNNTYTGQTTVSSGTLQIGNGGTTGALASNSTVVGNNGNLAFSRSDTSTYGGVISGAGTVTIANTGAGATVLTGNNTYSGPTTIASGTLQIGDGATSGALASNVSNSGALVFNRSDNGGIYAGQITGTGSVTQAGSGTTTLTGDSNYSGGTTISQGTLQLGNASAAGSITGDVTDNGTLIFDRSNAYTFAGVISGGGNVTQAGSGQTTLTATETYTGATAVNNGTLVVNGSIALSSGVTIGSGGTIGGSGTTGKLTVGNNGTVTNSFGTLTVAGNFVLGAGSTYSTEVTPTGTASLNVNGTADLSGGALTVTPVGTGFSAAPITILQSSAGLQGTFSSVTTFGTTTEIPFVTYTKDDVLLTFAPSVTSLLPATSANTNQSRVGNAIDFALTHDNALAFEPVTGQTGTTLTQTLSELSGETAVAFQNVAVSAVGSFMGTLFDPSVGGRGGLGAGIDGISDNHAKQQVAFNGADSDMPLTHSSMRSVTVWTEFYGYQNTTDGDVNLGTHRTTATQYGGTVGLDYRPKHGDGAIGIAFGMTGNSWNLAEQLGKGQATAYQVGTYYSRRFFDTYITAGLSYARYSTSTDRTVNLGGANLYHADFVSNSVAARAEAGHSFHTDMGLITPYANFQADDIGVPHYAEKTVAGSPSFALTYTGKQHYDYTSEAGIAWNALLDRLTDFHARAGWLHDYAGGLNDTATFSAFDGASFLVDGASPPKNAAHVLMGLSHNESNVVLALNAEAAVGGNSTSYGGTASISYRW